MECLIGITGDDFVLLAADTSSMHSVLVIKHDTEKMFSINDRLVMAVCGESGDTVQFAEYIGKNIALYKMRHGYDLSTHEAANYTRRELAESLRSRSAYAVNMLLGGFDVNGPQLYYLDYLGSLLSLPFGLHGYGSFFGLSLLDRKYRAGLNRDEAYALLQEVVAEIQKRLVVNLPSFKVRLVDRAGVHTLKDISSPAVQ